MRMPLEPVRPIGSMPPASNLVSRNGALAAPMPEQNVPASNSLALDLGHLQDPDARERELPFDAAALTLDFEARRTATRCCVTRFRNPSRRPV